MDLDAAALWYATRSPDAFKRVREMGVDAELLVGTGKEGWKFVAEYYSKHGELPGIGIVAENTGAAIKPPDDGEDVALGFLVERLHERGIHRALKYGLVKGLEALENDKQDEAVTEVFKLSDHLRKRRLAQVQVRTLGQIAPEVLELYERTKRGEIGIPFPWPTMTAMTMGLWPGTLTFFVARPGVGKTWTAVIMALFAWAAGKKVLIVSPELNRAELGERLVAKYGSFSYSDMVTAKLGMMGETALRKTIAELVEKGDNFFVLDDEEHIGPDAIEQAIETVEPDVILIDSLYMLRVEQGKIKGKGPGAKNGGGNRSDRIVETVDWARSLSRRVKRPIVGISQLSRDARMKKEAADTVKRGKGTGGLEDAVALSDALFQDAHNLFALFQDRDMRLDKQLVYVPLKVRRNAMISHVCIRWDMEKMDFSEIGTVVPESGRNGSGDDGDSGGKRYEDRDYGSIPF